MRSKKKAATGGNPVTAGGADNRGREASVASDGNIPPPNSQDTSILDAAVIDPAAVVYDLLDYQPLDEQGKLDRDKAITLADLRVYKATVQNHAGATVADIAKQAGVSERQVKLSRRRLLDAGVLVVMTEWHYDRATNKPLRHTFYFPEGQFSAPSESPKGQNTAPSGHKSAPSESPKGQNTAHNIDERGQGESPKGQNTAHNVCMYDLDLINTHLKIIHTLHNGPLRGKNAQWAAENRDTEFLQEWRDFWDAGDFSMVDKTPEAFCWGGIKAGTPPPLPDPERTLSPAAGDVDPLVAEVRKVWAGQLGNGPETRKTELRARVTEAVVQSHLDNGEFARLEATQGREWAIETLAARVGDEVPEPARLARGY